MERAAGAKHKIIITAAAVLGAVLCIRLFMLTVLQHEKWEKYSDAASLRAVYETAPRGDILDRNGTVLAGSRPVYAVKMSRGSITSETAMKNAASVTDVLIEEGEDVSVTINEIKNAFSDRSYDAYLPMTLADDISAETADKISDMQLAGISIAVNYERYYPYGNTVSHVIGYLGRISEDDEEEYVTEKGYRKDALVGKSGIEKTFEDKLKGTDAVKTLQIDSSGTVTKKLEESSSIKGSDVRLTIDLRLQQTAEEALEKAIKQASLGGTFESRFGDRKMTYAPDTASGAAAVIDVNTGKVLALASYPDFNPGDFVRGISDEKWQSLQRKNPRDPMSPAPLYNIATMTAVQPGSTFKPVTAMAALSCGLDRNQLLYDGGSVELGNRTYGCSLWNDRKASHGYVDLESAMKVSCNYYFYDIACGRDLASDKSLGYSKKITNDDITGYAARLGLGSRTGIEIGESEGVLPSAEKKNSGLKAALRNYILSERETYFKESVIKKEGEVEKIAEKIINWADKDLTLEEIIGKLNNSKALKDEKVRDLASVCKYDYFNQMGWSQGDTFNISIGQGDNAYTPIQMASYMSVLGNGGAVKGASLIEETKQDGVVFSGKEKENMKCLVDAMSEVTDGEGGSLQSLFSDFPYSVAAKTGTAQKAGKVPASDEADYLRRHLHLIAPDITFEQAEKEAGRLMKEYPDFYNTYDKALRRAVINLSSRELTSEKLDAYKDVYDNFAWTAALAPADNPQIAVAVLLVQGKTSSNAAPVVREIIGEYGEIEGWEK